MRSLWLGSFEDEEVSKPSGDESAHGRREEYPSPDAHVVWRDFVTNLNVAETAEHPPELAFVEKGCARGLKVLPRDLVDREKGLTPQESVNDPTLESVD